MRLDYMNKRKKELKLTNAKLSELSGVPMGTLSKIMAGIIENPKLNTLQAIAKALECTIDDFYDGGSAEKEKSSASNEVGEAFIVSELEKQIILKYRSNPQMQEAVLRLLEID